MIKAIAAFIRAYWPSLCVVAVIIYATMSPDPTPDIEMPLIPGLDKIIHAIMFGGLTGAMAFDYQRAHRPHPVLTRASMLRIALIAAIAGALDETAQASLTTERSGDILDWLADCAGIAVAVVSAPAAVRKVLRM